MTDSFTPRKKHAQRAPDGEQLRALLEGMLDPVVAIDGYGRIVQASRSVLDVFGWERSELIGQNVKVLTTEPIRSEHDGYLERYRKTGHTGILGRTREFQVMRKDGSVITCELSVSRVDPAGSEPLFIGSFRDVTVRKEAAAKLRDSERRIRAVFDQEFQFVGLLDPRGIVLEVNYAALEGAGQTREDAIGKEFWETRWWSHCDDARRRIREAVIAAAAGEFVRFEIDYRTADGRLRVFDFSLKPIANEDGEVELLIPEGRDITELKHAAERENAMLRSLAEIGESASMLAHEIKNPITAVNIALRAVADRLGEDQAAILEDLASRMQKLEKTMRRTLGFVKPIEVHAEDVDPQAWMTDLLQSMAPVVERAGMSQEGSVADGIAEIHADPFLLDQLVTNLIHNAVDAGSEGGRVRLRVELAPKQVGWTRILVEDDGPGIPEDFCSEVFKPFSSAKLGGTGLGLALCRKIAEAHGGTIRVDRGELGGARFSVHLPPRD